MERWRRAYRCRAACCISATLGCATQCADILSLVQAIDSGMSLPLCLCSIGINGCSLKTEENLQVMAAVPLDRLLLETDCPWCEIRPSHAGELLLTHCDCLGLGKALLTHCGRLGSARRLPLLHAPPLGRPVKALLLYHELPCRNMEVVLCCLCCL